MNKKNISLFLNPGTIILMLLTLTSAAQVENTSYLQTYDTVSPRAKTLSAGLLNNNFVKNNEYFGKFTEGITYIGSILQPELTYAFSANTSLTTGWYIRYFYGLDKVNRSLPVIRFDYRFMKGGRFIIGQLNGGLNHELIEPVYSPDNYFSKNPENGVQLLVERFGIKSDIWMDWEHFLMPGDSSQEQITGGMNLGYDLLKRQSFKIILGFNGLIHHFGGQVDISEAPMQTRANLAPGLRLCYSAGKKVISDASLSGWVIQALDLSPTPTLQYSKGYGIYTTASAGNRWITLVAAWWHAKDYFAPLGDYLFQSVSGLDRTYTQDMRNLINFKLLLNHEIAPGVKAGVRFESYHDLDAGRMDFCYGLNILAQAGWGRKSHK